MRAPSFARWVDWGLLGAAFVLVLASSVAMASTSATLRVPLATRHAWWIVLGVLACAGASATDYRRWIDWAWVVYAGSLLLLALVLLAGTMRLGATRWLSLFGLSLQPSEPAKFALICVLARWFAGQPAPLPSRTFWGSCAAAALPAALIFLQPDLGTATVLGAVWLSMAWLAGASRRDLRRLGGAGLVLLPVGWFLLKDYQRDRLLVFLDPQVDPLGAGYTIIQSAIAIGSGGLWGRGWFAGTQNQLSFLPERHSDFVFSVIGEEWGWLGCVVVIGAFGVLVSRALRLAVQATDPQGRLLAGGIAVWLAYQAVVNMGMVMGLLPVVGIPLPLMSYGGSSMVTLWVALGLLQSVHRLSTR